MKTTLTKKLLTFIFPLVIAPVLLILIFYYLYLTHLVKSETIELTKNIILQKNSLIKNTYKYNAKLQDYLQEQENFPVLTILDKELNILADTGSKRIGENYALYSHPLKSYIAQALKSDNSHLMHHEESRFVFKPLVDKNGKMFAFMMGDYHVLLEKKQSIVSQTFIFISLIIAFIAFINVVLTIIFSFSIISPIKLLTEGTKKAASGNLELVSDISSDDEIGVLVSSFNEMITKLKLSTAVFKNTQEAIMITDADVNILDVNDAFASITGYTKDEVIGLNPTILKSGRHDQSFYEDLWESLTNEGYWQGNIWNRNKDGKVYPEWLNISVIKDDNGIVINYIAVFSDITQLKENEKRLNFLAHHDVLTTLPNRLLLSARLEHSIDICNRLGSYAGVCFLDLDNFKIINDSYGHDIGDEVLKEAASRLQRLVRADDTLARIGGDEFVFVFENLDRPDEMSAIADKIVESLQAPFKIEGKEFFLGVSVGISIYPDDGKTQAALSKNADTAMYVAKNAGKNTFRYYNEEMTTLSMQKMTMELALKSAIVNDEMVVYYQPKYNVDSKSIQGLEALVRWQHPTDGLLAPDTFIPMTEETNLIIPIGEIVLTKVCHDAVKWSKEGILNGRIAVNVSGIQINKSDFKKTLENTLRATKASPDMIEIEVTETVIMEDPDMWISLLTEIKKIGVHISIDDFGTGYSSLNHLRRLPVDTLKIDRSFVQDLTQDSDADTITRAIINLAKNMGLGTVAEGVETKEQTDFLVSCGCDLHQGFLYAKPICQEDIYTLLRSNAPLN